MTVAKKKTLFITMLIAALLGGNALANTGFEGGTMTPSGFEVVGYGNLRIFEDPNSQYEAAPRKANGRAIDVFYMAGACAAPAWGVLLRKAGGILRAGKKPGRS